MNVARRARALACVVLAAAPGAMAPATAPDEQAAAPAAIVPLYVRPLTSNGGIGNYDLYVHELGGKTTRLTNHKEKDGQADWSPVADQLVFVSGRTGKGDLYLLDVASRGVTRLTWGTSPFLYPQWSPDGTKVTMLNGNNDNHDVYVIDDVRRPAEPLRALTTWVHDHLRPGWSPDGKKPAFYSDYNPAGDSRTWV